VYSVHDWAEVHRLKGAKIPISCLTW